MITDRAKRAIHKLGGPTVKGLRAAGGGVTRRYDPARGCYVGGAAGRPAAGGRGGRRAGGCSGGGGAGRRVSVERVGRRAVRTWARKPAKPRTAEERREIVRQARLELETYILEDARDLARAREAKYRREYERMSGNRP